MEFFTIDGKIYGMPHTLGSAYVFYNKDMFDAAGEPYPPTDWSDTSWTWNRMMEVCSKIAYHHHPRRPLQHPRRPAAHHRQRTRRPNWRLRPRRPTRPTRFLREIVAGIQRDCPELGIGVRLSAFDFPPFRAPAGEAGKPLMSEDNTIYGFGADPKHPLEIQLDETIQFLELAERLGIELICLTAGSPSYNPHIQRPALFPPSDGYAPPEDPPVGVSRQIGVVATLKAQNQIVAIFGFWHPGQRKSVGCPVRRLQPSEGEL